MNDGAKDDLEAGRTTWNQRAGLGWGFCVGMLLHALFVGLGGILHGAGAIFAGALQVVYIVPAILTARSRGMRSEFKNGLILSAVFLFLISAICWGTVLSTMPGYRP